MNFPFRYYILFIISCMLFVSGNTSGQIKYPLSRQDSALVQKFIQKSEQEYNLSNLKEASRFLNNVAMIYWEHNFFNEAISYYEKSLKYNEILGNENGLAMIHNNLAMIYSDIREFETSLDFFNKTLTARRAKNERIGIISALINKSVVLNNLKRFNESVKSLEEALELAREMNDPDQMKSCYGMLSETYEKAGDAEKSFYYFNLYRTFHEMVQDKKIKKSRQELENERLKRQLAEVEKRNKELEVLKKEKEIKKKEQKIELYGSTQRVLLEHIDEKELFISYLEQSAKIDSLENLKLQTEKQAKIDKQNRRIRLIILVLIFIVILTILSLLAYRQKQKANKILKEQNEKINFQRMKISEQKDELEMALHEIERKNDEINSSINYAKLIQRAMLNKKPMLNELIPDSFILFKPRDIVSGDFYWYTKIHNKIIVTAVDCTGHGVPGAMVSMIGYNILNSIIEKERHTDPNTILSFLDDGINDALHQSTTKNKDGMDMALVSIDFDTKEIIFAGAKNPVVLVQNGQINRVKGSNSFVGGHFLSKTQEKRFKEYTFHFREESILYMFSDGIIDQFGGEKNKKLMYSGLENIIKQTYTKPMRVQKEFINTEFEKWKGKNEQVDDVLMIGLRIP